MQSHSQQILILKKRSKDFNSLEQKSWFWGAIWRYKSYYVHVILASLISNLFVLSAPYIHYECL